MDNEGAEPSSCYEAEAGISDCLPPIPTQTSSGDKGMAVLRPVIYSPSNLCKPVSLLSLHNHHRDFLLPRPAVVAESTHPTPKVQVSGPTKPGSAPACLLSPAPRACSPWAPFPKLSPARKRFPPSA